MFEELEKEIFQKVKEFLRFEDINDEIFRIDEKLFYFLQVRSAVRRKKIRLEIEFKEKRSQYFRQYKFENPVILKNVEIEKVMWENKEILELAEKIETLKLIETTLDVIIDMFKRRAFALNIMCKKD